MGGPTPADMAGTPAPPGALAITAALDPATVVDAHPAVRAAVAFCGVALLGGLLVQRYGPFVERGVAATIDRPAVSLGYGVATHLVIAFAATYLATRVAETAALEFDPVTVGLVVLLTLAVAAAVVGFTVLGGTLLEVWGTSGGFGAPVAGALLAAGAAVVDPGIGRWAWVALVSAGLGGPVRRWVHASMDDVHRRE